mmetsp:Transcript_649/g.944  ORF Transcript_649/g.944 Transcript_649/m.944 type:complete len:145 (-) Transcript_649:204-638(-)|eukprot:CAMPEP_0113942980 /NCGR_PEP_ID=MMETSP1339-20121228/14996_1 /TAXON_ID=94617 /ORGANISM="Fibrocapsa japonica" /LENGTH=144 /DNA_ID=CAMNT_0000947689 /DNA_START=53 /DNA_END=487 /DNA_ORIENTATION=- /assembly_acc=CAM_ASM_000762
MATLEISSDFGYVIIVAGLSWLVNMYNSVLVMKARKKYGVEYPNLYALETNKHKKEFDSTQRGHQNFLENWAPVVIVMILNGLVYPKLSAGLGLTWVVGRVLYSIGYSTKGPSGRMAGALIAHLGDFPLMLMTFYTGSKMCGLF